MKSLVIIVLLFLSSCESNKTDDHSVGSNEAKAAISSVSPSNGEESNKKLTRFDTVRKFDDILISKEESESVSQSNTNESDKWGKEEHTEYYWLTISLETSVTNDDNFDQTYEFTINNKSNFDLRSVKINVQKCFDDRNQPLDGFNCNDFFVLKGPFLKNSKTTGDKQLKVKSEGRVAFQLAEILSESGRIFRMPLVYSKGY